MPGTFVLKNLHFGFVHINFAWTLERMKILKRNKQTECHLPDELTYVMFCWYDKRPVRKVSRHFEYLENWARGLDVTWQPVRGDLIAHRKQSFSRGASRQWDAIDSSCVLCEHRIHNVRASRSASWRQCACPSTALGHGLLAKHHISQVSQHTYSPDLAPCDFWLFPKPNSPLKGRRFVNTTVTHYASSVNGVSLPTD